MIAFAADRARRLGAAAWVYRSLEQPYHGFSEAEVFVEIPSGSSTTTMARRLADAGVVPNAMAFHAAVWLRKAGRRLQAGEYRFDRPATPIEVVDRLTRGDVYLRSITFREGLTIRQMSSSSRRKASARRTRSSPLPPTPIASSTSIQRLATSKGISSPKPNCPARTGTRHRPDGGEFDKAVPAALRGRACRLRDIVARAGHAGLDRRRKRGWRKSGRSSPRSTAIDSRPAWACSVIQR
jgi:hypothetical protein